MIAVLGIVVFGVAALVALRGSLCIRTFQARYGNVTKGTVNMTMLWAVAVVATGLMRWSPFHLLWMFPVAFVLAQLSMFVFPFTLLNIPGYVYGSLWCVGMLTTSDEASEAEQIRRSNSPLSPAPTDPKQLNDCRGARYNGGKACKENNSCKSS